MNKQITINPELLNPYPTNAKKHSDEVIKKLAESILVVGFNRPVVIDDDNTILAGHKSVLAAIKAGLKEIPAYQVIGLSDANKKAFVLAENRHGELSEWDFDLLSSELDELQEMDFDIELTGFDEEFIIIEDDGLVDEDLVPEITEETISKAGDIWILDGHRVMCGDSTNAEQVEKLLNGKTIDLIFSDPPYGVSYGDKNAFLNLQDEGNRIQTEIKNDHMTVDETGKLWADVFSLWSQYQSDYSSYYIASPCGGDLLLMMMMMMNENNMPLKHTIIWNKNNHVLGRCDYMYKHEPILYGWTKRHKFYGKGQMNKSVWDIAKPLKNDLHPTMKPVELVENAILNSSSSNQIVADMFLGSGTTLIAAEKNNRVCYGMELDEKYTDVIVKRWQDFTGKDAVLESSGENFDSMIEVDG